MTRTEKLAQVRKGLTSQFPKATITTNDDANPATPMIVKATWSAGRIWKVVRADSIYLTPEQFIAQASAALAKYQTAAIRDSEQQ